MKVVVRDKNGVPYKVMSSDKKRPDTMATNKWKWEWLNEVENGTDILTSPVARIYPNDDSEPEPVGVITQPLHDTIEEVLQRHMDGISFTERNAGPKIDSNMTLVAVKQ